MNLTFKVSAESIRDLSADVMAGLLFNRPKLFNETLLKEWVGPAREAYCKENLSRERLVKLSSAFTCPHLLLASADSIKYLDHQERIAYGISSLIDSANAHGFGQVALLIDRGTRYIERIIQGMLLGAYTFNRYKSKKDNNALTVIVHVAKADIRRVNAIIQKQSAIIKSVNFCRDLVNEPANVMTTDAFLKKARQVARNSGLGITVLEKDVLKKRGFNGLLTVGAGGKCPPRMAVLQYRPKQKTRKHLCLVGKGIMFDSGGISLKSDADMWTMKGDMAGAAAVLGTLQALALLKPRVQVSAILCLAENLPDSNATRPGDIFIAANKKSVHVENTDAEGRLVLSDGLTMAGELKATHIVDVATLTGSCVVALGEKLAGLLSNEKQLSKAILRAAELTGEGFWPLPLYPEYREMLDIHCADINNIGNAKWAGAIIGGLFLKEFVPDNTAWAHLDIAGPFLIKKKWKYYCEGATGFGVRTLVKLAELL